MELLSYPSMSESEELIVRDFLDKIIVVDLDNKIKELAIAFRKNYKLKLPDAIVAATAKSLNANLLTNDLKLTRITEINTQSVSIS
ncbi:MAG: type II toxin-antitoxin system VapC family toxin [Symploca sp. SIO1B1]|nr:type II toxin-antitoxin system VapC family toxin [Symploca sp. SIO1B1]